MGLQEACIGPDQGKKWWIRHLQAPILRFPLRFPTWARNSLGISSGTRRSQHNDLDYNLGGGRSVHGVNTKFRIAAFAVGWSVAARKPRGSPTIVRNCTLWPDLRVQFRTIRCHARAQACKQASAIPCASSPMACRCRSGLPCSTNRSGRPSRSKGA